MQNYEYMITYEILFLQFKFFCHKLDKDENNKYVYRNEMCDHLKWRDESMLQLVFNLRKCIFESSY
jgi:hypothetical protein